MIFSKMKLKSKGKNTCQSVFWSSNQILRHNYRVNFCFLQAGVHDDGTLNYGEFVAISIHLKRMANDEHLHKAFSFFDQDQSGYIEIEELRAVLNDEEETNSEDVIIAIMHDVDTDKVSIAIQFLERFVIL